ncbi:hypothetical protein [Leadbetterella byssophila]|uniref:hypothetical protein n=1 Tax=Leadbetterella byssophila TaxID=316068 RepID=UPI0039A285AA
MSEIAGGNLVFKTVVDDSDLKKSFERAKKDMEALAAALTKEGSSIDDVFSDVNESLNIQKAVVKQLEGEYAKLQKEIAKLAPGQVKQKLESEAASLKKELDAERVAMEVLNETSKKLNSGYTDLNRQLRFLQSEMIRMEQAGQRNTKEFRNAEAEAIRLSSAISNINNSVRKLRDGSGTIKGINEMLRGLIGGFSAGTGVVALFSGENKNLERIMVRLQSAMAMAIGMQEVSMALDKNSTFQTVTLTRAKALYTAVLGRLTAALGGSAIAARALMAALTGGLSLAIGAAIVAWDRYTTKQEEAKKKLKEKLELEKDARAQMLETRLELESTIRSIEQFNGSRDEEKKMVKELNEKYGETFGHFKTLNEWYDTLIQKGGAYVESLFLQAKAQAALKIAIEDDAKVREIANSSSEEYRPWLGEGGKLAKYGKMLLARTYLPSFDLDHYGQDPAKLAHEKVIQEGKARAEASKKVWEDLMEQNRELAQKFNLGGHDAPGSGSGSSKNDPFIKDLEAKKSAYEQYAGWINSLDENIRNSADGHFKDLLKNGANWLEYLNRLRSQIESKLQANPNDQNLIKQLREVTAEITGSAGKENTVLGKFEKDVDAVVDSVEKDLKAKLAAIGALREQISETDPLSGEKTKVLDQASTSLTIQLLRNEQKEMENTLKKYEGFLAEKLEFDREYAEEKRRIEKKINEATSEEEKAAHEERMKNLEKQREKYATSPEEKEYQELLKAYQTFEQKKQSISEKYEKEIAKARLKNNVELERLIAKKRDEEVSKAAYDEVVSSASWSKLFNDLDRLGKDQIKQLIKEIEDNKEKLSIDLGPDALKKLRKELKEAEKILSKNNPFAQLSTAIREYEDGEGSIEKVHAAMVKVADQVGGIFGSIISGIEELGLVTKDTNKELLKDIDKTVNGVVNAVSGYFSGDYGKMIGGIIQAVAGVSKLLDTETRSLNKQIESLTVDLKRIEAGFQQLAWRASNALGEAKYEEQLALIRNLNGQLEKLQELRRAESQKSSKKRDEEKIQDYLNQIDEVNRQIADIRNEIKESVVQTTAAGLAADLADSIVNAFSKGEDAAKAWGEVTNSVIQNAVKNALKMKLMEQPIQQAIDQLYKDMGFNEDGTGSFDGLTPEEQQRFKDNINKVAESYKQAIEATGDLFKDLEGASTSNPLAGAIKGMSQESANIIAGHLNATRMQGEDAIDLLRQHLLAAYAIANKIDQTNNTLDKIERNTQKDTTDPLRAAGITI